MAAILDLSTLSGLPLVSVSVLSSNGITAVAQTNAGANYLVNTGTGASQLTSIPTNASIESVNNLGEVVFIENVGGTYPLASFLYNNGTSAPIIAPVDFLQGFSVIHQDPLQALETVADNINDYGVIVGYVVDQDGIDDGFKDTANSFTQVSGSAASYLLNDVPLTINDAGVLYGYNYGTSPGTNGVPAHLESYAFSAYNSYTSTGILEVSLLFPQYQYSTAVDSSSDNNYFVGNYDPSYTGKSSLKPIAYYNGPNGMVTVPSTHGGNVYFNTSSSVNTSGVAVGEEIGGSTTPFFFDGTIKRDISTFLPANSSWIIKSEIGIGDNNEIVGTGTHNGSQTVYVMNPKNQPSLQLDNIPLDGNYHINSTPSMPDIDAELTGIDPTIAGSLLVTWVETVTFDPADDIDGHADAASGNTIVDIMHTIGTKVAFTQNDIPGELQGGTVTITATAIIDNKQVNLSLSTLPNNSEDITIVGDNPSGSQVDNYIKALGTPSLAVGSQYDFCRIMEAIIKEESGGTKSITNQFLSDGTPTFNSGGDGGVGLTQITPGQSTIVPRTNGDIWNWQTNLSDGFKLLSLDLTQANNHFNNDLKTYGPKLPAIAAQYGFTSVVMEQPTTDQLLLNAVGLYRRPVYYSQYDGESSHHLIPKANPLRPTQGVVELSDGYNDYVDTILGLY